MSHFFDTLYQVQISPEISVFTCETFINSSKGVQGDFDFKYLGTYLVFNQNHHKPSYWHGESWHNSDFFLY